MLRQASDAYGWCVRFAGALAARRGACSAVGPAERIRGMPGVRILTVSAAILGRCCRLDRSLRAAVEAATGWSTEGDVDDSDVAAAARLAATLGRKARAQTAAAKAVAARSTAPAVERRDVAAECNGHGTEVPAAGTTVRGRLAMGGCTRTRSHAGFHGPPRRPHAAGLLRVRSRVLGHRLRDRRCGALRVPPGRASGRLHQQRGVPSLPSEPVDAGADVRGRLPVCRRPLQQRHLCRVRGNDQPGASCSCKCTCAHKGTSAGLMVSHGRAGWRVCERGGT